MSPTSSVASSSSAYGPSYLRALLIPVRQTSTRAVRSLSISGPLGSPPPASLAASSNGATSPSLRPSTSLLRRKQSSPSVLPSLSPPRPASPVPRPPPAARLLEPELDVKGRPRRQHRSRPVPTSALDEPLFPLPPALTSPAAALEGSDANMTTSASNHMMKNSKRGRPFIKDIHDLFSTLIVSLDLTSHRQFFKSYPNSFTTDEACQNLSSLKFSQSNRSADPKDPARIITTTTTTTFTMTREMAKDMCQHFMDARLIENAADKSLGVFKDRGVYQCTPKGLHILERFVAKNGISHQQLLKVFASQPICMKLLHLERRSSDDELYSSRQVMEMLWKRFAGRSPNVAIAAGTNEPSTLSLPGNNGSSSSASGGGSKGALAGGPSTDSIDQTQGIAVRGFSERIKGKQQTFDHAVSAMAVVDWLLDFTTMGQREEAVENAAQFVRHGWLELVCEKGRINKETALIVTVRGRADNGSKSEGEFRATDKAVYRITDLGARVARWGGHSSPSTGSPDPSAVSSKEAPHDERYQGLRVPGGGTLTDADAELISSLRLSDKARAEFLEADLKTSGGFNALKESHTTKLQQILEEPALRSLFREFLRLNFCEENLNFWQDVQDFKKRFSTTSSAAAGAPGGEGGKGVSSTMERHNQGLIAMAFIIYNGYLAPHSPSELNIDHNLRAELVTYVSNNIPEAAALAKARANPTAAVDSSSPTGSTGGDPLAVTYSMHASQLQTMLRMYERIQTYIFRLMATDSVPKFCKTERFLSLMRSAQSSYSDWPDEAAAGSGKSSGGGRVTSSPSTESSPIVKQVQQRDEEADRAAKAYLTISQAANEKAAAAAKAAAVAAQ